MNLIKLSELCEKYGIDKTHGPRYIKNLQSKYPDRKIIHQNGYNTQISVDLDELEGIYNFGPVSTNQIDDLKEQIKELWQAIEELKLLLP